MKKDTDATLIKTLMRSCGFSLPESKVYIAALRQEKTAMRDIARHTGINRTSLYEIVKRLVARGVLGRVRRNGGTCLIATHPLRLLEEKQADVHALEKAVPQLQELFALTETLHSVTSYTGVAGFQTVLKSLLVGLKKGDEVLIFGDGDAFTATCPGWTEQYAQERLRRGVRARLILRGTEDAQASKGRSQRDSVRRQLMQIRTLPEAFGILKGGFDVCGDTAVFYAYGKEPQAVLIRDATITALMHAVFELLWNYAGVYENRV